LWNGSALVQNGSTFKACDFFVESASRAPRLLRSRPAIPLGTVLGFTAVEFAALELAVLGSAVSATAWVGLTAFGRMGRFHGLWPNG
jgi:hypothetical protein